MKAIKNIIVLLLGLLSAAYLANIGVGVIELIPDNVPVIGNLDEAGATLLLLHCLSYFGINPGNIIARPPHPDRRKNADD